MNPLSYFSVGTLGPELQTSLGGFSGCRGFRVAAVLPKARTSVAPGWLKDKERGWVLTCCDEYRAQAALLMFLGAC